MLTSILTILVAAYLVLALLLYAFQPQFIYFPERRLHASPAALDLAYQDVWLDADGVNVHGWWIPAPAARRAVLFLHGNAGNIAHRLDTIELLHRLGLAVLIIDYRGYGRSGGHPDERGTYRDAAAAYDYLVQVRKFRPAQIVIHGRSLGAAVAVWLASERPAGALVLESAFTSVRDMARRYYPFLPGALLVRVRYPSLDRIARIGCPVLIMHSPDDEIVPYAFGRRLFQAAPEPKRFFDLRGGHNDGFILSGSDYVETLAGFIDEFGEATARGPSDRAGRTDILGR